MTRRKSLNIFDNGKIRNMIRIVFLVTIFLISNIKIFANNSVCEKIYSDCFYNIPKKMITYYKPYNKVGFVNKDEVFGEQSILLNTVRTVTAVASEESEAIKIPQETLWKEFKETSRKI